ncbi:MAG: hypothetical protein ACE5E6_05545 [Phycisphaerae bacterium]
MRTTTRAYILTVSAASVLGGAAWVALADRTAATTTPFSAWNGRWHGSFVAYDITGHRRYRLDVTQVYRPAGADQQSAVFTNRAADGSVETVHAVNLVRDGKLICRVRNIGADGKPTGDIVEHRGTRIGPGHIIWHRRIGTRGLETFNERVDGDVYRISGVGIYGDNPLDAHIFEGTYTRVTR